MAMFRMILSVMFAVYVASAGPAFAQTPQDVPALKFEEPAVTVLSTGSGPKRPLRYKAAAGSKERIDLRMEASMSMAMEGMGELNDDAPTPITMTMDIDVTNVAANGDITSTFTFVDASMEGPGLPPGTFDAIRGVTGTITMSDRGLVRAMSFEGAKGLNPMIDQLMSSSGLDRMSPPLPEEPLGVGAKWEVTQAVESGGMRIDQQSTYEITAMDAASVTMAMTVRQSAASQALTPPGMPPGVQTTLMSMDGTGTGRMTLADGSLVPRTDMSIDSQMTMDVSAEGQSMRMSMRTAMKMTMAVAKR
jgi:hypothetical protein